MFAPTQLCNATTVPRQIAPVGYLDRGPESRHYAQIGLQVRHPRLRDAPAAQSAVSDRFDEVTSAVVTPSGAEELLPR